MASNPIIQDIQRKHYGEYLQAHKHPAKVIKGVKSQIRCRTKEQGVSHYLCPVDGSRKEINHSCRHKSCTICGHKRQQQWLSQQQERLIHCDHYHVVFTLPSEYHTLWLYNRDWFIKAQFEASVDTLRTLLEGRQFQKKADQGKLKATPGLIATLHTWGRSLNLHPHIHILVTAGGLDSNNDWQAIKGDYLLPIKQVKALYRGKLQSKIKAYLESNDIRYPKNQQKKDQDRIYRETYKKDWSVRIQEKYSHGKGVLIYLSRYLGSNPIKPEQLTLINRNKEILFSYWSHRDQQRKQQRLTIEAFLNRYLLHQPRSSTHSIRYYGLYSSSSKKKRQRCERLLGKVDSTKLEDTGSSLTEEKKTVLCDCCQGIMQLSYVTYSHWRMKNPLYKSVFPPWGVIKQTTEPIVVGG
jgi:hypothetical protein